MARVVGIEEHEKRCSICRSPVRGGIEVALLSGIGIRGVAAAYRVSRDAVSRHLRAILPNLRPRIVENRAKLDADLAALRDEEIRDFLPSLMRRRTELSRLSALARQAGDLRSQILIEKLFIGLSELTYKVLSRMSADLIVRASQEWHEPPPPVPSMEERVNNAYTIAKILQEVGALPPVEPPQPEPKPVAQIDDEARPRPKDNPRFEL